MKTDCITKGECSCADCPLSSAINELKSSIHTLQNQCKDIAEVDPLIAFRGEPKDYGDSKLTPSLFRDSDLIQKESYLFELYTDYGIMSRSVSNIEKAITTQHYAAISRMLDISFNALIALYFACSGHAEEDGVVYIFAFPEYYSPHSHYVEESYSSILRGKHLAYPHNFMVLSHSSSNERIVAQKGGFIFFPGAEFHPIDSCYYRHINIPAEHKEVILKDLDLLFSINHATLFPQKDNISDVAKERFKKGYYTARTVSVQNEVETALLRLSYELELEFSLYFKKHKKELLRRIRKEEENLLEYISTQQDITPASKEELNNMVNRKFKSLKTIYQEVTHAE